MNFSLLLQWLLLGLTLGLCWANAQQNQEGRFQIIAASENYVYVKNSQQIYSWSEYSHRWRSLPRLKADNIERLQLKTNFCAADDRGSLWIFTPQKLFYFDPLRFAWSSHPLPKRLQNLYQSIFLLTSIEIWRNAIWVSSPNQIWRYEIAQQSWSQLDYPEEYPSGALKKGPDENLWLSGVARFDGIKWQVLDHAPNIAWRHTSQHFSWDEKQRPWLISKQGIFYYSWQQQAWQAAASPQLFTRPTSLAFYQGKMWVAEYGQGLYQFIDDDWQKVEIDQPRPSLASTQDLFTTRYHLWLNTYFGVGSFDGKEWASHYDYTDYLRLSDVYNFTLLAVILLLIAGVLLFVLLRKIRTRLRLEQRQQEN